MATPSTPPATTVAPAGSGSGLAARVFSFPMMCMFLLAAVIFAFCVKQFAEPDIWWHLRYARDLLQHHTFSPVDTYSFTAAGSPRPNYEWLSEVPFFLAFQAMGLQGILALYFALIVLIFAGVYYRSYGAGRDCKNATLFTLAGIFLAVVSIGPRTILFGWLCMVGLLLVLDHFRQTGKGLWLLPPLFALWINLHGSWVFGMVVLVLTIASGLVEGEWGRVMARRWSAPELRKLLLASAASLAALFINPFGYKLVLYPFDFLFRQQTNILHVEEWQGVDFSSGNGKLMLIVLVAVFAAAVFSRRRWRLDEVLVMAFALWAALSHSRFLFFAGIILPPMLTQRLNLFSSYEPELDKPWLNAVIMAGIAGGLIFFFPSAAQIQQKVDEKYPTAALAYMQQQHLKGRIFNEYLWGGYMDWKTPELKPFIDGRADIFVYNGVFDDHWKAMVIEQTFETLDKYRIDYILVQKDGPFAYLLQHSSGWHMKYSDKVAVLFERAPAAMASVTMPEAKSY